ncbi:NIPSNAP family protein [Nocardia pseudovaccinii]|uniref:NIPSNAP family protein n=1 Tax=Nocardia pseudovaccinii TaxID=189540 RepID=UPI003D8C1F30
MIVEERVYTLRPGATARYLEIWHERGRSAQIRHLGIPLGVYTCDVGELNTITFLWRFDSPTERVVRRDALLADTEFAAFRAAVRELMVSQRNRLLTPVSLPRADPA